MFERQAEDTQRQESSPPLLSICIVTYKRRDILMRCIESLIDTVRSCAFEVLLCDNNSQDGSAELVATKYPRIRLFVNKMNVGFAAGNNQLMKEAAGEYILLLNNDCIVRNGAVDAMLTFMRRHPDTAIVGGKIVLPDGVLQPSFQRALEGPLANYSLARLRRAKRQERALSSGRSVEEKLGIAVQYAEEQGYDHDQEVAVVIGAFMMIRKEFIVEHGGFGERYFMYREDSDLCVRARSVGWKVYYCHGAEVEHHHIAREARDPARASLLEVGYCESQLEFCRAHFGRWRTYVLMAALCVVAVLRAARLTGSLLSSKQRSRTVEFLRVQLGLIPRILGCHARRRVGRL